MEALLFNEKGLESGKIALESAVFARPVNEGLVHRLLLLQQANARVSSAHTKTRSDRNGSTRKLYKQKGTGQARVGDARSPVRRGGGVAFGPTNATNYTTRMNKKERRIALFSLLSSKASASAVKVLENIAPTATRTKDLLAVMDAMQVKSAVLAVRPEDVATFRAGRNIPHVKVIGVNYLNPHDLLKYRDLVLTKASLEFLLSHFA